MVSRQRLHDNARFRNGSTLNKLTPVFGDHYGDQQQHCRADDAGAHDVVVQRRCDDWKIGRWNVMFKLKTTPGACLKSIYLSEWLILTVVTVFTYYLYYYHDNLHFHVLRTYAWAGYDEAQHLVGQRYVLGKGVEKHHQKAMEYFKLAADQGHPKSSHNLALGHVLQYTTLKQGEARRLLNHASKNGVRQADIILSEYCDRKLACND